MASSTLTDQAVALIAYLDKNTRVIKQDDSPTIQDLLSQSRNAHLVYRRALPHRANGVTVTGDAATAADALSQSARLRAQAEINDPLHQSAAWQDDLSAKFPHEALLSFYDDEVHRLVPPVAATIDPNPVELPPVMPDGQAQ